MKKTLFFIFMAISSFVFSQKTAFELRKFVKTASEQELVNESSTYLQDNQLYLAEIIVDKLLTIKPESSNYNYRKGYILLVSKLDFKNAIPCFEKAILDTDNNFDMYSVNEKSASTDAFYHLAKCYHMNEEFEKAKKYYNQFTLVSKNDSDLLYRAHTGILQCDVAQAFMARPKKVEIKNIGKEINTQYPEYSPVISLDGSAIYFTSRRPWDNGESDAVRDPLNNDYPEDIYVSYTDENGGWTAPDRLGFCVPERNEATVAVSGDERRIYVYQDKKGGGDLYYSDFGTNSFNEIESISYFGVNTPSWEPHCTVTTDGLNMYFVSDREGGLGGRDIYRIVKLPDGSWSLPQNLGPTINSAADEDSPFIASDNKTLYFSSNGARSMGGFDIFVSIRDEDNVWGDAINLGYPINSTGDDLYYTTTIDGLRGYMTSFRKNGFGEKDIYEIHNDYLGMNNIAALKGHIRTVDGKPIPADLKVLVRCVNCEENIVNSTTPRLRDGTFFSSVLEHCRDYEYTIVKESDKTELYKEIISTKCDNVYDEIYREILLDVDQMKVVNSIAPDDIAEKKKLEEEKARIEALAKEEAKHKYDLSLKDIGVKQIEKEGGIKDYEMTHYFGYNGNKLTVKWGDLRQFLDQIEEQVTKYGRQNMVISIEASASKVPTITYVTNEALAKLRADNMKQLLKDYIASNPKLKGKVKVEIVKAVVDGPEFENDAADRKKYQKFQFIYLKSK